ncbi:MAG: tyrosine-type recombinase/integrase [Thaumarchaeota archaeon]|nr:tyrosine-type recombinase/integrase [Nitrososphaerota archaeon]
MDKSLLVYDKYVKSEVTRAQYKYFFKKFLQWAEIKNGSALLHLKDTQLQAMIEDYVMHLRKRLSPNSITPIIAGLKLYFAMNDRTLNWERIQKMVPEKVKRTGYSAYQTEDIQKMLESCGKSKRNKALIHFLTSTGCRVGAIPDVKLKHFSQEEDCKSILFYEGSAQEYYGFLTPEASNALDSYLEERRKDNEYLDEQSPLFREDYQVGVQKANPMTLRAIHLVLHRIVKTVDRKKEGRRHNIMTIHGFRKRFATIVKLDNKISWAVGERLLGHQSYLDPSYFRPTKDNLLKEFKKVIPDLTIDESERLMLQNKVKDEIIKRIESEKDQRIAHLEDKMNKLDKILKHLNLDKIN